MRIVIVIRCESAPIWQIDDSEAQQRGGDGGVLTIHQDGDLLVEGREHPGSVIEPGERLDQAVS